ncbi:MAG TPA: hypothetical protein VGG06_16975 [Thermoanaerobaculia bacterium]
MEKSAKEGIEKTRQAVNARLDSAKERVSAAAKGLRKTDGVLHEKARQLSDAAREKAAHAREGCDRMAAATEKVVRENPGRSAAVAALLGFCLGWALSPARQRTA